MSAETLKPGDRVQCGNRCWEGKGTVLAVVKDDDVTRAWVLFDDDAHEIRNANSLGVLPKFEPVEHWVSIARDGEPYQDLYRTQDAAPSDAVRCVVVPAETWEQMTQGGTS